MNTISKLKKGDLLTATYDVIIAGHPDIVRRGSMIIFLELHTTAKKGEFNTIIFLDEKCNTRSVTYVNDRADGSLLPYFLDVVSNSVF